VYITELIRNNKAYSSVTNIGFRPTFSEVLSEEVIEVHIIGDNFCESWKEMEYELRFLKYLRSEKKFPDSKALVQQIRQDIYKARFFFQSSLSQ